MIQIVGFLFYPGEGIRITLGREEIPPGSSVWKGFGPNWKTV
jgi:hypothetical protein